MDTGGMVELRDIPLWAWLTPIVIVTAWLVYIGVVPRWIKVADLAVGTYGVLSGTLLGSVLVSLRRYLT